MSVLIIVLFATQSNNIISAGLELCVITEPKCHYKHKSRKRLNKLLRFCFATINLSQILGIRILVTTRFSFKCYIIFLKMNLMLM